MTSVQKSIIIVLAIVSGACEFFGTWTVWASFKKTASVATDIKTKLKADSDAQLVESLDVMRRISLVNGGNVADDVDRLRVTNREFLKTLADRLGWNQTTAWGLRAFFAGAFFGVVAAILAVAW